MTYENLLLEVNNHVAHVRFNRPDKANALHHGAWNDLQQAFEMLDTREDVRVIILSGEGKHFCSGIDLTLFQDITAESDPACGARSREYIRREILKLQAPINAIEACCKPVIAAISGGCIGAGVDIISACDLRYATIDSYFSIREIDMGMVADLGTLQRLPRLIPHGIVREMAFTGRNVSGNEAEQIGLINKCTDGFASLTHTVNEVALNIAAKSPLAIRGTKHILNYSREHSIDDGLKYVATWNAGMLLSEDLRIAVQSKLERKEARFRN